MVDAVSTVNQLQFGNANATQGLADNFDTFLSLLTTQLQNQDPLEPLDSTEFTNQLVQFSGVEQQIRTNEGLADLISIMADTTAAGLSGYLGKEVIVNSPAAEYSGEPLTFRYQLPQDAADVTISVRDAEGNVIYSVDGETASGFHDFQWNGETLDGADAGDGFYSITINGEDGDGNTVNIPVGVRTVVTGIDLSTGEVGVNTSAGLFGFSQILSFGAPD